MAGDCSTLPTLTWPFNRNFTAVCQERFRLDQRTVTSYRITVSVVGRFCIGLAPVTLSTLCVRNDVRSPSAVHGPSEGRSNSSLLARVHWSLAPFFGNTSLRWEIL